ncbi:MAG TPA: heme-binding domain-containing protein [Vicinamibacterales bacterium]|jgi:hypothetical protein|nr:heme-binding domain-containing protein [Vicinamibacterales bacterium]
MATRSRRWLGLLLVLLLIQAVPIDRTNPPVETEIVVPAEVHAILQRSCYDCHSNTTVWPWYSRVAPVSWLVAHDVHSGREHLNFSTWNRLDARKRAHAMDEIDEHISRGEMPLSTYLWLHPVAKLSDADKAILHAWTTAAGAEPSAMPDMPGMTH